MLYTSQAEIWEAAQSGNLRSASSFRAVDSVRGGPVLSGLDYFASVSVCVTKPMVAILVKIHMRDLTCDLDQCLAYSVRGRI